MKEQRPKSHHLHVRTECLFPFATKSGQKQHKRYGCIFNSLSSGAVHLEVLDSMDASSFFNAFNKFMSRRGHL